MEKVDVMRFRKVVCPRNLQLVFVLHGDRSRRIAMCANNLAACRTSISTIRLSLVRRFAFSRPVIQTRITHDHRNLVGESSPRGDTRATTTRNLCNIAVLPLTSRFNLNPVVVRRFLSASVTRQYARTCVRRRDFPSRIPIRMYA